MLKQCSDNFARQAKSRITIQTQIETTDSYGGRTITWNDTYELWAIVTPVSISEGINSKVLQSEVTHKMIIRYNANLANTGLTAKYRIELDNRYFSIQGIENIDLDMKTYGNFYQRITCRDNGAEYVG